MDAITRHRLNLLGVDVDTLCELELQERMDVVYRAFVEGVPVENLSHNRSCVTCPAEPHTWPRATDRLLRDHQTCGLGGTSFSMAYALRDLLHGVGANAHCTMGRNLVTEQVYAAVVAYVEGGGLLYDPGLLAAGPVPVRPGGTFQDPLGTLRLEPRSGATLTLTIAVRDLPGRRAIASLVPLPVPPQRFRQAWVASFHHGRPQPLRLARRQGNVIRRYHEQHRRVEFLTPAGRESRAVGPGPVDTLHDLFGIDADCLRAWFDAGQQAV